MSTIRKVLFFKQIAMILSIMWTLLTLSFFYYQINNEKNHVREDTIYSSQISASQVDSLLHWSFNFVFNGNLEEENIEQLKNNSIFSLQKLAHKIIDNKNKKLFINSNDETTKLTLQSPAMKFLVKKMKLTKKDQHMVQKKEYNKYIVYLKPVLSVKNNSLIGSINIITKIPTLKEYNAHAFNFLFFTYLSTWLAGLFIIWFVKYKSHKFLNEKMDDYEKSIYSMVDMMERRDSYTAGHSKRVAYYSSIIAEAMNLSKDKVDVIFKAGMLHDIGKIGIPDSILLKPDILTKKEYEIIKMHPQSGYEILCKEPFFDLAKIVLHHHERYDGKGYPHGLTHDKTPILSQIIAVADTFDAITTNRAYREASTQQEAVKILEEVKGSQLNPLIVDAAKDILLNSVLPKEFVAEKLNIFDDLKTTSYYIDQLTGYLTTKYLSFLFHHLNELKFICVYQINCKDFTSYNKKVGWQNGNIFLQNLANTINENYKDSIIIRVYGDTFLVIFKDKYVEFNKDIFSELVSNTDIELEIKHISISNESINSLEKLENTLLH